MMMMQGLANPKSGSTFDDNTPAGGHGRAANTRDVTSS